MPTPHPVTDRAADASPSHYQAPRTVVASLLFALSLLLIALNLRTPFASLPVLLPDITAQLGLSNLHGGNFTTLPTLCLGLFAPLAPFLAQRFGMERTILALLFVLAAGIGLRAMGLLAFLYGGAILAGMAIAVINVLLPALIKRDFSRYLPLMTALYTMCICGSGAMAAAFSVPLQQNLLGGSWRLALGFWALPVLAVTLIWLPQLKKSSSISFKKNFQVRGLWRDATAWQVTLLMGFQSALAYIGYGWMAPILHERGLSTHLAGNIASFSILMQMAGCLSIIPLLAGRHIRQSLLNVALSLIAMSGFLGLVFVPSGSGIWICAAITGFGQGAMLAAAMMVIVLRSSDAHVAAHLSGMAQCVGYCIAALGPFAMGAARNASDGLTLSAMVILIVGLAMAGFGFLAGRPILCKVRSTEHFSKS